MVSKKEQISRVLRYHGYKVSEACLDAIAKVEDEVESDSWDTMYDEYDSWGYKKNDSSWL